MKVCNGKKRNLLLFTFLILVIVYLTKAGLQPGLFSSPSGAGDGKIVLEHRRKVFEFRTT